MKSRPHIVLLGDSILMDSVADYLAVKRVSGVLRTDCTSICDQFEFLKPDLILFEMGHPCSDRIIALLQQRPGLALIGLDLNRSRAIVLSGCQHDIGHMEDLYQLVQTEIQKQESWSWGGKRHGMNWNDHS